MAKNKDFGGLENNNKNIGNGINALVKPPVQSKSTAKEKDIFSEDDTKDTTYPLRMPKRTLKALKSLALERDTSVKELVTTAIFEKYSL